ncbi:MAG TPA: vitamin K epoxide reductase family protein, partial [candidate division WWE3 bacterium]|nr:vitamin K epoxide reductase family protein [candidate division WWE3 bacterium]
MIANFKQKTKRSKTDILIVAFSILGMVVMAYLAYLKFTEGASSFCDLSEGLSCSAVNQSIYSEIFGIPVAILGFSYFALVLGLVLSGAA